jgi:hypothetical protein
MRRQPTYHPPLPAFEEQRQGQLIHAFACGENAKLISSAFRRSFSCLPFCNLLREKLCCFMTGVSNLILLITHCRWEWDGDALLIPIRSGNRYIGRARHSPAMRDAAIVVQTSGGQPPSRREGGRTARPTYCTDYLLYWYEMRVRFPSPAPGFPSPSRG